MTDRVPGAPGQYKAVVAEAELQKMQAGESFIITMTRDDQPIVEGTPYSKETVLPDALAKSLCQNIQDPTPADAFAALASGFVSYHDCASVDELNAKIAELTEAQSAGTEKTYYLYLFSFTESLPGGRWSVTIHKPNVSDPEKWAGVTATVVGSKAIYKLQRELYADTWLDWEWENPRMALGEEYRTTERCNGKPVWVICVDCGTLPNNNSKAIQISDNLPTVQPISCKLFTKTSSNSRYTQSSDLNVYAANYDGTVTIMVKTTTNHSDHNAYAILKYFYDE